MHTREQYIHIFKHTNTHPHMHLHTYEHLCTHIHRKTERGRNTFQIDKLKPDTEKGRKTRTLNSELKENASNGAEPKHETLRSREKCGVSIGRGHDLGWPGGQSLPSLCQPPVPLWLAALLILFLSLNQTPDFPKVETKVWSGSCPLS